MLRESQDLFTETLSKAITGTSHSGGIQWRDCRCIVNSSTLGLWMMRRRLSGPNGSHWDLLLRNLYCRKKGNSIIPRSMKKNYIINQQKDSNDFDLSRTSKRKISIIVDRVVLSFEWAWLKVGKGFVSVLFLHNILKVMKQNSGKEGKLILGTNVLNVSSSGKIS